MVHADAFNFVRESPPLGTPKTFDLIIVDLPDPHHESLAKLYSIPFYANLKRRLAPGGMMALQLGSPFFSNRVFWGSLETLKSAGFSVVPYHLNVPSFGEWGFALASDNLIPDRPIREVSGRFLDREVDKTLFVFAADLRAKGPVEATTLTRPRVVEYFTDDWNRWN